MFQVAPARKTRRTPESRFSIPVQKLARKRGRPPKYSVQYSSKLKKDSVQVTKTDTADSLPGKGEAEGIVADPGGLVSQHTVGPDGVGIGGVETLVTVNPAEVFPRVPKVAAREEDSRDEEEDEDENLDNVLVSDNDDFVEDLSDELESLSEGSEKGEELIETDENAAVHEDSDVGVEMNKGMSKLKMQRGSTSAQSGIRKSRLKLVGKGKVTKSHEERKPKRTKGSDGRFKDSSTKEHKKSQCRKCGYTAISVEKLESHMARAHKDDTVYSCSICEFQCAWNREYYKHMKVHFNGPPYECDFEACDYVVDRIQPLLYHRMVSASKVCGKLPGVLAKELVVLTLIAVLDAFASVSWGVDQRVRTRKNKSGTRSNHVCLIRSVCVTFRFTRTRGRSSARCATRASEQGTISLLISSATQARVTQTGRCRCCLFSQRKSLFRRRKSQQQKIEQFGGGGRGHSVSFIQFMFAETSLSQRSASKFVHWLGPGKPPPRCGNMSLPTVPVQLQCGDLQERSRSPVWFADDASPPKGLWNNTASRTARLGPICVTHVASVPSTSHTSLHTNVYTQVTKEMKPTTSCSWETDLLIVVGCCFAFVCGRCVCVLCITFFGKILCRCVAFDAPCLMESGHSL